MSGIIGGIQSRSGVIEYGWSDYYASSTIVGWNALTSGRREIKYKKIGSVVAVSFHLEGSSNNIATTFTLPYNLMATDMEWRSRSVWTYNNSVSDDDAGTLLIATGSNLCRVERIGGAAWSTSNNKIASGSFVFPTA